MSYDKYIDAVLASEQGYVDDTSDNGGPTNYGITQAVARANGWTGDMKDLPLQLARDIYARRYITEPKFDLIATVSDVIAGELIDSGVNMGPSTPATMLQRWINAFNSDGSHYADVFVDGRIGQLTADALKAYLHWRGTEGEAVMLTALNCTQGERYLEISEHNKSQRKFTYGWMRSRVFMQLKGL